jgi:HEAT repeat protein
MPRHSLFPSACDKVSIIWYVSACFILSCIGGGCNRCSRANDLPNDKEHIDALLEEVYSADYRKQDQTAAALAKIEEEGVIDVVPRLLELFKEAEVSQIDDRIRRTSKALAFVGAYRIEPILEYASKTDLNKRQHIIFVLRVISDNRAIPFLVECLKADDTEVRLDALRAISDIPDERAFEPVLALLNDKSDKIRIEAINALCAIHDYRALQPLREMYAQKQKGDLQSMLIGALGVFHAREYVDEFIELDKSLEKDDYLHEAIADALGNLGDVRALELLSERLLDNTIPSYDRVRYAVALNKIPDTRKAQAAYQVWKDKKTDKNNTDVRLRTCAAFIVANSSSQYSLEAARWVLEHGYVSQRAEIVAILGRRLHWRNTSVLALLKIAAEDSDEYVRTAARREIDGFSYEGP